MVDVGRVLRAPVDVTLRLVQALDDLAAVADRARRNPDPVEEARERIDTLLIELRAAIALGQEVLIGVTELTGATRAIQRLLGDALPRADALTALGERLEASAERVLRAEQALVESSQEIEDQTRALLDGGRRLTAISERIDGSLGAFRAALPRLLEGLDTVEDLEGAVETVAETVEPLQGAAQKVGRATRRLSRKRE
jgi:DNA repair ATPase RecN